MLVVALVLALFVPGGAGEGYPRAVAALPYRAVMVFACVTFAFAAAERWQDRRQSDALASRERVEAQAIQRALLPAALPGFTGCELAVRWQPASTFGGDCYDAIPLSDMTLALSIADVCGKGLPAALVMSSLQASVRAFALADPTPRSVVTRVNQALCRNVDLRRFVTLFYGVYDARRRRLIYTNAGHNPPAVVRADGSIVRLATGGMVVGLIDAVSYGQDEVTLDPGDRVVLFTDGITEAESAEGIEFGDERLLEAVLRHRSSDPEALLRGLFDDITRFAGRRLRDDATALAIAIR
jgi:sigma-B regulation protein RsbU (phosphoserine phosphatase)